MEAGGANAGGVRDGAEDSRRLCGRHQQEQEGQGERGVGEGRGGWLAGEERYPSRGDQMAIAPPSYDQATGETPFVWGPFPHGSPSRATS